MAKVTKSWKEKLAHAGDLPKVHVLEDDKARRLGGTTMLIPAPLEVDEVMRTVPAGKLLTVKEIRETLARKHDADISCPFATGIFAWMAAHAAEEAAAAGQDDITPYWRTLKTGGELNSKYPGGIDALKALLEAEGHTVVAKGKKWLVADYTSSVAAVRE
jgi:hypothetical protein